MVNPGHTFTELVASWNATTPDGSWVEVCVRAVADDGTAGWYVLGRWASDDTDDGGAINRTSQNGQATDYATVYTDTLAALNDHTLQTWQLKVTLLRRAGTTVTPSVRLVAAMASGLPKDKKVPVSALGSASTGAVDLAVPTYSQELHQGHYPDYDNGGEAWCSPTSTAMVVGFWGTGPTPAETAWVTPPLDAVVDHAARNVYDYTYDGCGNWPFNTAYAAHFGLEGFVTRLRSLAEAELFIAAGIPLVASVSFSKGELKGAGYGTNGHLMVIRGFTAAGDVVANDPASHLIADNAQVRVVYDRAQFENVWVPRQRRDRLRDPSRRSRAPARSGSGELVETGRVSAHVPPGWPPGVPPAHTPGWEAPAVAWLLDNCPPDYRLYAGWRKNPVALAWLADRHIDGQVTAMRQAYREARVELGPHVTTEALAEIMGNLEAEGLRLVAAKRSAALLLEALQGKHFIPRL